MQAVIAGAGETPYLRRPSPETTTHSLLAAATLRALGDAGLEPRDVDGLAVASFTLAPDRAASLAWRLGLKLRWLMEDTSGGAAGLGMLRQAVRAVDAGDAECVLVLAGDRFGEGGFGRLVGGFDSATRDHLAPIPHGGPNALFALLTRAHMREHGLPREAYGELVVAQRRWAALNSHAVYREPLSLDEYLSAPLVADPLCLLDCVPVVAGGDAVVVTTSERARKPAASVAAFAAVVNADDQEGSGLRTGLDELAPALWERAGLGPRDVDVVSVYDDYPVMVFVQLADLGFGSPHDVLDAVRAGRLALNTSGGQLAAGQAGAAGGLHGVVETVQQLRGLAGERQVADCESALVTGYGIVGYRYGICASAAVLRRVS